MCLVIKWLVQWQTAKGVFRSHHMTSSHVLANWWNHLNARKIFFSFVFSDNHISGTKFQLSTTQSSSKHLWTNWLCNFYMLLDLWVCDTLLCTQDQSQDILYVFRQNSTDKISGQFAQRLSWTPTHPQTQSQLFIAVGTLAVIFAGIS